MSPRKPPAPAAPKASRLVAIYRKTRADNERVQQFFAYPIVAVVDCGGTPMGVVLTPGGRLVYHTDTKLQAAVGELLGVAKMAVAAPAELHRNQIPLALVSQHQREANSHVRT